MPSRDVAVSLRHMQDHARRAVALLQGRTRTDLDDEGLLLDLALVRLLEVIGEAANRIPDDEQARYPEIPWAAMVGLRNRLIHGYDSVDLDIVWQIVTVDLPPLIEVLEKIISQ